MNLFQNFANSLKTGISQQMAGPSAPVASPVAPQIKPAAPVVAPAKTATTSNPSAVSPAIKTPSAQTYIASQTKATTPAVTAPVPPAPTAPAAPTTPTGYVDSPGTPGQTGNSAMDSYISAYKNYINAQTNNAEVSDAKKYLNQLILDDKKAQEKARNSGETMGFAGGEQARVARNNSFSIDAAAANLDVLQGAQTNQINAAKTGVDFAKDMNTMNAPIVVDGVAYQKQPDGSLKAVTTKQLNPSEQYGTGAIGEYNFAKANGYTGTFSEYQNEDANRKKSIAAAGVGNSGLSSKQYTALNQITTRFQADPIINQSVKGATASAIADQIIANPNSATNQLKSLYVLVKNLDPDSAVREGELALANQTQSYLQQFGNTLTRITEGRVVSPDAAVELAKATKELMGAWNDTAKRREQQYNSQSQVLGVGDDFNAYIQGAGLGYNDKPSAPQQSEFSDIEPSLEIDQAKKVAYLPRAVWTTLGSRMDALLADVAKDGYTLKIKD